MAITNEDIQLQQISGGLSNNSPAYYTIFYDGNLSDWENVTDVKTWADLNGVKALDFYIIRATVEDKQVSRTGNFVVQGSGLALEHTTGSTTELTIAQIADMLLQDNLTGVNASGKALTAKQGYILSTAKVNRSQIKVGSEAPSNTDVASTTYVHNLNDLNFLKSNIETRNAFTGSDTKGPSTKVLRTAIDNIPNNSIMVIDNLNSNSTVDAVSARALKALNTEVQTNKSNIAKVVAPTGKELKFISSVTLTDTTPVQTLVQQLTTAKGSALSNFDVFELTADHTLGDVEYLEGLLIVINASSNNILNIASDKQTDIFRNIAVIIDGTESSDQATQIDSMAVGEIAYKEINTTAKPVQDDLNYGNTKIYGGALIYKQLSVPENPTNEQRTASVAVWNSKTVTSSITEHLVEISSFTPTNNFTGSNSGSFNKGDTIRFSGDGFTYCDQGIILDGDIIYINSDISSGVLLTDSSTSTSWTLIRNTKNGDVFNVTTSTNNMLLQAKKGQLFFVENTISYRRNQALETVFTANSFILCRTTIVSGTTLQNIRSSFIVLDVDN